MRFLMVDRVLSLEPGRRIETRKLVSITEEFFRGHFTLRALTPGALLVEATTHAAGRLICATYDYALAPTLTLLEDVRVTPDLPPGRVITVVAELVSTNRKASMARAVGTADGATVVEVGRMIFAQWPHPDPATFRARFALGGDCV